MTSAKKQHFLHCLAITIIVAFCVNVYVLNIQQNFSIPLLSLMFLSPFLIYAFFPITIYEEFSIYAMYALMCGSAIAHFSSFRLSTIAYAGLFISIFLFYRRLLYTNVLSIECFADTLKKIVYAYAIVLIIQQLSTFLGLPVFNKCWNFENPFKLNTLALEPSYIGPTITLLMYAFVESQKTIDHSWEIRNSLKQERWLWISYFYISLTCGSSLTLLVTISFIFYLIDLRKNFGLVLVYSPVILFFVFYSFDSLISYDSFYRMVNIVPAILSGDVQNIIATDLSASARLAPPLMYLNWIDFGDVNFLFGRGIDYSKNTLIVLLLGTDEYMEQGNATGGLFPAFFLDYGFITGLFFLWNLKKFAIKKFISYPFILWIIGFMPIGFNTAMQWMFFVIMTTVLYFNVCQKNSMK